MLEDLKPTSKISAANKIDNNLFILVNAAYALSIVNFSKLPWGVIAAIVLLFIDKDTFRRNNLKYIIKTNVIYLFFIAISVIISGWLGYDSGSFIGLFYGQPVTLDVIEKSWLVASFFAIFYIVASTWFYLRMIGGWIAFFRKEPLEGHFGIRLRKA